MAETIGSAYVQIEPSLDGVVPKIDKEFGGAGASGGKSFGQGFASVVGTVGKVALGAAAAGTAAVAGLTKQATSSFANYQQLVGGVETLFGQTAQAVMDDASEAFTTAGMSANEYMETVTGFAAALKNSLGSENEWQMANYANTAVKDMSDNANKMGTSMASIQNAYQGFAKQNFTMLDNLKLGYGGTKTEMERLMREAERLEGYTEGAFDVNNFSDVVEAIHIIQEDMGITGTTFAEAGDTISGSLASVKASWENVLTAIGTGDSDKITETIDQLVETASVFAENMIPTIEASLGGISQLISKLAPQIAEMLPGLVSSIMPSLLSAGVDIVKSLADGILEAIPTLLPCAIDMMDQFVQFILDLAPQVISAGMEIILQLANGISESLPTLVPQIVNILVQILQTIIDNLPLLVEAANSIVQGLADGIISAIPILIDALPGLVSSLVDAIVAALPILIQGTIQLVSGIVQALPDIIVALVEAIPQIIDSIVQGLIQCLPQLILGAVQLVLAIVDALPEIIAALKDAMPEIARGIVDALIACGPMFIEAGQQLFMGLIEAWGQIGPQLLSSAGSTMSSLIANITTYLAQLPERMAYYAGYAVGNFIKFMQNLPSNLASMWSTLLANVKSFGTSFIQNAPRIAKDFATQLVNGLKQLPGQMISIGKDIVNGLLNGIKGSWDSLTSTVKEMASSFVQGVKDSMKIGSPSKVMADEVGQWIPAGIAMGIQNGMGYLDTAISDMTQQVITDGMSTRLDASYSSVMPAADVGTDRNAAVQLLATYLPIIAAEISRPIEVNQNDRGMFSAVRSENAKMKTATGYHALA